MKFKGKGGSGDVRTLTDKNGFFYEIKKNRILYLMLVPGLIFLIFNNYLPMFGIMIAFKKIHYSLGILGSPFVGFKNFEFLFASEDALIILRNTLGYNLTFILLDMVVPVAIAIGLNEIAFAKLKKTYQTLIFMPHFLSWVVVSVIGYAFMSTESGLMNNVVFPALGINPVNFYQTKGIWPFLIVFFNIWKNSGYASVVYLAAITGIDSSLYEAARIDGANKFQQIRHITIPEISGLVIMMMLLACGRIFTADFGLFFQMPLDTGTLYPVTNVVSTYVYRAGLQNGNIEMSAAAGLLQSVVGLVMVLSMNFLVKKIDPEKSLF